MTFIKEMHFSLPGIHKRQPVKRPAEEPAVFNEAQAKIRATADKLWDDSYQKADGWTTEAASALIWDHINKPSKYDSDAVVVDLAYIIAEAEAQKLKTSAAAYNATIARLKFNHGSQVEEYERLLPEQHVPLAASPGLYEEYMETVRKTANVIMDAFQTCSQETRKSRFKYELPSLLHQLPYIRGKAA